MREADEFDSRLVEEGDHIPDYITRFCFEQEASLADSKLTIHLFSGLHIRCQVTHDPPLALSK